MEPKNESHLISFVQLTYNKYKELHNILNQEMQEILSQESNDDFESSLNNKNFPKEELTK